MEGQGPVEGWALCGQGGPDACWALSHLPYFSPQRHQQQRDRPMVSGCPLHDGQKRQQVPRIVMGR